MMKITCLSLTSLLTAVGLSFPVQAENFNHLNQLLSTKQCQLCDLSGSGLVMADLSGASLIGANLAGANLSQANLAGADLRGANLSGASLYGANLTGANLSSAIFNGTDLREAYLTNANLMGTNLQQAYVQGAKGIANNAATPELFYGWGLIETKEGNYREAIENHNKALMLNPEFAPAYLARGYALLRLGNEEGAILNAKMASELYEKQEDIQGKETSENFVKNIEAFQEARKKDRGNPQLDSIVRGVAGLMLQFLLKGGI
ncbi:pentapeptide repeat-containing protein [Crocosphaera sp. XPORK-15E]|uniref:pentapeptide repeat-containing protein n=1 Tax=Crocosphaera sp. XPORK-15E TaxID=3110247 RepID=UPI002B221287|nr:pentapeptide repeat-containing protein [Crocosphaera sp. XPORK-15E]MEA5534721.1 pentapeptide repeat-containing protein [Crocosphaera sp. XPORK-15E]